VSQAEQWVFPQHPWTCVSHDDPDLFAAVALVAMYRAFAAGRFFRAKTATVQSQAGIIQQSFGLVAKVFPVMVAAIDANHRFNGSEFASQASIGLARGRGFYTELI
jgi:hypothetical protein